MVAWYEALVEKYPIISIEDKLNEGRTVEASY